MGRADPHNGSRDTDWEWRARRAEAEASAARLMGGLEELLRVAHWKQLEAMQNSLSWRMLAGEAAGSPLRARRCGRRVAASVSGHRLRRIAFVSGKIETTPTVCVGAEDDEVEDLRQRRSAARRACDRESAHDDA